MINLNLEYGIRLSAGRESDGKVEPGALHRETTEPWNLME